MTTALDQTCSCPDHAAPATGGSRLSRRNFLRASAAAGALAALSGPLMSSRLAYATAGVPYTGDVLVVLSLRGGFDGMSAIVPAGDPAYYAARPNLAVPPAQLLERGPMFGLHPALAPLQPYWRAGTFGAVHAVGQTDATRSHFSSLEEMERAAPGTSLRTGWLDRTLGVRGGGSSFQAAVLGSTMASQSLTGSRPEIAMLDIDSFGLDGGRPSTPAGPRPCRPPSRARRRPWPHRPQRRSAPWPRRRPSRPAAMSRPTARSTGPTRWARPCVRSAG